MGVPRDARRGVLNVAQLRSGLNVCHGSAVVED
ncbi:MAG: hypothetical protein BWZ07_01065 [Alphaproteobacteria bacterium ADurb.BinA280]|nr:MAG: hypothetical protein BWZ07_01065 [Alphaproteobacteria bacterium ADurb.BinA280]